MQLVLCSFILLRPRSFAWKMTRQIQLSQGALCGAPGRQHLSGMRCGTLGPDPWPSEMQRTSCWIL